MDFIGFIIFILFMVFRAMAESKKQQENRNTRLERQEREIAKGRPLVNSQQKEISKNDNAPNWFPIPELGKKILEETKNIREITQTKKSPAKNQTNSSLEGKSIKSMESIEGTSWKRMESTEGFNIDEIEYIKNQKQENTEIEDNYTEEDKGYLELDPAYVTQGIIWSEVLQPPRARRSSYWAKR